MTAIPSLPPVERNNIPREIIEHHPCVVWRYAMRGDKSTKPPFMPTFPERFADVCDPATWSSFEECATFAKAFPDHGLGVVIGGVVGKAILFIDFDALPDDEHRGEAIAWRRRIYAVMRGRAFIERSPGGGEHFMCYARLPRDATAFLALKRRYNIEIYNAKRYSTLTGNVLDGSADDLFDCQPYIDQLVSEIEAATGERCEAVSQKVPAEGTVSFETLSHIIAAATERRADFLARLNTPVIPPQPNGKDWSSVFAGLLKDLAATGCSKIEAFNVLVQSPFVTKTPPGPDGKPRWRKLQRIMYSGRTDQWAKAHAAVGQSMQGQDVARSLVFK